MESLSVSKVGPTRTRRIMMDGVCLATGCILATLATFLRLDWSKFLLLLCLILYLQVHAFGIIIHFAGHDFLVLKFNHLYLQIGGLH